MVGLARMLTRLWDWLEDLFFGPDLDDCSENGDGEPDEKDPWW